VYDRLLAYQDYSKTNGGKDISGALDVYKYALDNWDSVAEQYGNFKSAKENDKAVADYEGKANLE
jgi:hypothetical protein